MKRYYGSICRSSSTVTPQVCLAFPDYNSKPAWVLLVLSGSAEYGTEYSATVQGTPLACQPVGRRAMSAICC